MSEIVNAVSFEGAALIIEGHLSYEEWESKTQSIIAMQENSMFWLGDALVYGEDHYPDKYTQVIKGTRYSVQSARNAAWVSRKIPPSHRKPGLSWSAHQEIARLQSLPKRICLLNEAGPGSWTVKKTREAVESKQYGETDQALSQYEGPSRRLDLIAPLSSPELAINAEFREETVAPILTVDASGEPENRVKAFLLYVREFLSGSDEKEECDFCLEFIEEAILKKSPLCIKENIDISLSIPERIHGTKKLAKSPQVVNNPPSLEEITSYGGHRTPPMPEAECERCRDYYVSNNWKVGKNPMVDWKAAVNNWHRTWKDSQGRDKRNPNIQTIAQRAMQEAGFVE